MKKLLFLIPGALLYAQVTPPSTAIFDKDAVHEIRLTFKQADWYTQLTTDYDTFPDDTPYREASLTWGANKFDVVGVRFKGNSSYRGATTKKKPFRIKLNEFVKGQKIDGMASFGLSNAWSDPSFVREKPYYELAAAAGLPAARSNFAALYVNDEYFGLYILGEIVNGDFLKNHFAKGDDGGNLYKASEPGANLAYLGPTPESYQRVFSKESNEDANDWTDLIELARTFEQTPAEELQSKLDKLIDVDSFLTALALDNVTVNLDSYVGMAQNYYLYRRPSDQKWVWIPWDPSLAFGALAQSLTTQQMKELPLEWVQAGNSGTPGGGGQGFPGGGIGGGMSGARPIATKLWAVPAYKQRYRQIYQSLVDNVMVPSKVIARMNEMRDLIRPWVEKDTQKLVTMAQFEAAMTSQATTGTPGGPGGPGVPGGGGIQGGGAPGLQPFIEGRIAAVRAQLAGQTPLSMTAAPAVLFAAQLAGSSSAASQSLALSLTDTTKSASYAITTSAPWITVADASGNLPATVRVGTNATGMTPGTYSGSVTITVAGATNSPLVVPVVLTVATAPGLIANPGSVTFTGGGFMVPGGPTLPGGTTLTQTVTVISTAGASPFSVTIADSTCGNFLTATPTSGTTPATITLTANPTGATGNCNARVIIASSGLASAAVPVSLTLQPGGPGGVFAPAITAITNSASYSTGPVAPGTLVTIFGSNIGPRNIVNGTVVNGRLGTNAGGVQVTFDGTPAPVLYARFNQVGVIVPFEVSGKTQVAVQISMNGQATPAVQQAVSPTTPGIFTTAQTGTGQASIVNQTSDVNAANAPAAKGSTVSIYLTGAGQLNPAGTSGALGAINQTITAPVVVTIGGQSATVAYAGAVPGSLLGLYQINAVVPAGSASGSVPVQVSVGGTPSQGAVTMYVQ